MNRLIFQVFFVIVFELWDAGRVGRIGNEAVLAGWKTRSKMLPFPDVLFNFFLFLGGYLKVVGSRVFSTFSVLDCSP